MSPWCMFSHCLCNEDTDSARQHRAGHHLKANSKTFQGLVSVTTVHILYGDINMSFVCFCSCGTEQKTAWCAFEMLFTCTHANDHILCYMWDTRAWLTGQAQDFMVKDVHMTNPCLFGCDKFVTKLILKTTATYYADARAGMKLWSVCKADVSLCIKGLGFT